jgi:hypothetical protein
METRLIFSTGPSGMQIPADSEKSNSVFNLGNVNVASFSKIRVLASMGDRGPGAFTCIRLSIREEGQDTPLDATCNPIVIGDVPGDSNFGIAEINNPFQTFVYEVPGRELNIKVWVNNDYGSVFNLFIWGMPYPESE